MQHNNDMSAWLESSALGGTNQTYVEQLYEDYLQSPQNIDPSWRKIFDSWPKPEFEEQAHSPIQRYFKKLAKENTSQSTTTVIDPSVSQRLVRALQWINAFRYRGHLRADLDPLKMWQRQSSPNLDYQYYGLSDDEIDEKFNIGKYVFDREYMTLRELGKSLRETYCSTIGMEFMHINDIDMRNWLQKKMENLLNKPLFTKEEQLCFLQELTAAEGLERYLGAKFPGAKRFSLEGSDAFILLMKEIIRHSSQFNTKHVVIGMAHRGRLNLLVNVLGKKPAELFEEFAGKHDTHRTGDVKYHQGFSSNFETKSGNVHLALAFNPSHLEIVSPVVIGSVRARQTYDNYTTREEVLPITVHGDSAVTGQGIVQETLNMSSTRGYTVGGTIRIVINNRIGFTTSYTGDTRSTEYCTDIAKMTDAPIIHVNGDDPEAVAYAARVAVEFRAKFKRDIFIDLVSYRRHGHNEADEPSATQPMMYQAIKKHPTPRKVYADRLVENNVISNETALEYMNSYRDLLDNGDCVVPEWREMDYTSLRWSPYLNHPWRSEYQSTFDRKRFFSLANKICQFPESHILHNRVAKIYQDRELMAKGEKSLDWGMAEMMAYATLLDDGHSVRLSGEDSGRGTFFHRHAVVHNQTDGTYYVPLNHLHNNQGHLEIWDSVLSEEAVLAFEYGYASTDPKTLVIWEAQFGDFANVAQVVIDQFISSGEQKWGRMCGLTMLLPHGYEGQGPEHSSARLERYLQLCAQDNMQVCVPSTPAQIYHLLRRQSVRLMRRPLIVLSPKSLLRHPLAISSIDELIDGSFQNAIDEVDTLDKSKVQRVVLCSGKVYYDLLEKRRKDNLEEVAIVRIEQLYPYPMDEVTDIIAQYPNAKDFVWCQEEPQNQGAWYCSQHNFYASIPSGAKLSYAGRPASASPATGFASLHAQQQKDLVADALTINE